MAKPTKKPPVKKSEVEDEEPEGDQPDGDGEEPDGEDDREDQNKRINAIVTNRVKREMKNVLATLATMQESLKSLAEAKKPAEPEGEETEETSSGKKTVVDDKLNKKFSKMEKELAEEREARKRAEKERADEIERGKRTEMRNEYSSVLTELGINSPRLLRAALDQLEEDKIMTRDENGKIRYRGTDKYGIEQLLDPKLGLKSWVTTDGKEFLPAVEAGGSGTGAARSGSPNSGGPLSSKDFAKLPPAQQAAINLERACTGLPPLGEDK